MGIQDVNLLRENGVTRETEKKQNGNKGNNENANSGLILMPSVTSLVSCEANAQDVNILRENGVTKENEKKQNGNRGNNKKANSSLILMPSLTSLVSCEANAVTIHEGQKPTEDV